MKALGIIAFEDSSVNIEGLGDFRPVPATAFMGRYRIIDFILSNMTNSGIDSVQVYCKEKPRNLIDHLGDGRHYNINSKRGKLRILFGEKTFSSPVYNQLPYFHLLFSCRTLITIFLGNLIISNAIFNLFLAFEFFRVSFLCSSIYSLQ